MSARFGEPDTSNFEGAPTRVYEVWDWHISGGAKQWRFIGYRTLSLRQVLKYQQFGYHVERSLSRDRRDLVPLFPRLDSSEEDPGNGLDSVSVPKS